MEIYAVSPLALSARPFVQPGRASKKMPGNIMLTQVSMIQVRCVCIYYIWRNDRAYNRIYILFAAVLAPGGPSL